MQHFDLEFVPEIIADATAPNVATHDLIWTDDGLVLTQDGELPSKAALDLMASQLKDYGTPWVGVGRYHHKKNAKQNFLVRSMWCSDSNIWTEQGFELVPLRTLLHRQSTEEFSVMSRACQLAEWVRSHRFCGRCGRATSFMSGERGLQCQECHFIEYPRISPAMMVLVKKENQILLARHVRSKDGYYTALAGFLEAGENIEDAIIREVYEEVGLTVANPRYFGSQAWPFPHSLMISFTADYVEGDIKLDTNEIADAIWFGANDARPLLPPNVSIARRLIDTHWPSA